jgi:hypothetical protein
MGYAANVSSVTMTDAGGNSLSLVAATPSAAGLTVFAPKCTNSSRPAMVASSDSWLPYSPTH